MSCAPSPRAASPININEAIENDFDPSIDWHLRGIKVKKKGGDKRCQHKPEESCMYCTRPSETPHFIVPAEVAIEFALTGPYAIFLGGAPATLRAMAHAAGLLERDVCDRALVLAVEIFEECADLYARAPRLLGRPLVEAAGIKDISSKVLGTRNQATNVYCTMKALKLLKGVTHDTGKTN